MIDMAYRLYARQPLGIAVTIPGLEVHWVEAGVLTALAGSVCGLAGARIRRRPGLFCFILLPLWAYVSMGLLL